MASKNLFISRALDKNSSFHRLENYGINIFAQSLINFTPIPFDLVSTDWIFFYSKNGISQFFKKEKYDPQISYGVMGTSSADYFYESTGFKVHYTGNNDGKEIAQFFNSLNAGIHLTFIKAKNSIGSVEKHLSEELNISSIPVYDNTLLSNIEIPYCKTIALTSPLNAEAWFNHQMFKEDQRIFAIGKTTAQKIRELTDLEVDYCSSPSESSLFKLIEKKIVEEL